MLENKRNDPAKSAAKVRRGRGKTAGVTDFETGNGH
jgi:hypothetical protein